MQQAFKSGVDVQLDLAAEGAKRRTIYTSILAVEPERLTLRAPTEADQHVEIPPGTEVTLWRYTRAATYVTTVTVVASQPGDPPLLVTTAPSSTKELARRKFYRVQAQLPFRSGGVTGEVRNISGSGFLVAVPPRSLAAGESYAVEIEVPGVPNPLRTRASAVRVMAEATEDLVGMSLEEPDERLRDELVRFVFRRQRELLRRGELGFPWRRTL